MGLSAKETVETAFGSINQKVGRRIIAIFFGIQLISLVSNFLISLESIGLQAIGVIAIAITTVATIAATIGSLRSLRHSELKKSYFRKNIIRPFLRTFGANITTAAFAYLGAAVFLVPSLYIAIDTTLGTLTPSTILTSADIISITIGFMGIILALLAITYVTVTLILAQPLIAIDNKRMFEALDESIQKTKGNKLRIFGAGLFIIAAYIATVFLGVLISSINQIAGSALLQLVITPIYTCVILAALNHFSEKL